MSTRNMIIEEIKAYLDQLMHEHEESQPEIGDLKLIQKLEDEHVIHKLATVFTADHNISIPGVSKHGEADWISEGGGPYPESDEEFNGIELGAHKNGCITIPFLLIKQIF